MNLLVDDKGALAIVDLYKVHLSVDIYIQQTLSHPEYYDGPLDEIEVDHNDIVDESEEVLPAMYKEVINGELKARELKKTEMKETEVIEIELKETEAMETELKETEMKETEANHDNVNRGDEVHDDVSSDDIEDESFNYDSAMEVAFDDEFGEYDNELVEEDEMVNIIDYVNEDDQEGNNKKRKEKWGKTRKNLKGVIMRVKI